MTPKISYHFGGRGLGIQLYGFGFFFLEICYQLEIILYFLNLSLTTSAFFCSFLHQEGDRVFVCGSISGTYAEYALCNATSVNHLPESISFSQGAAIYVAYYTAYRALFQRYSQKHINFTTGLLDVTMVLAALSIPQTILKILLAVL